MLELSNPYIKPGYFNGDSQAFYIRADEGYLNARYTVPDRRYEIDFYEVEGERGKGYGKDLLRVAKEHARTIGADVITASRIISGESVGAICSVFGPENVSIDEGSIQSGTFFTDVTNATMRYALREGDPLLREGAIVGKKYGNPTARELAKRITWFNTDIALLSSRIHATDAVIRARGIGHLSEEEYADYSDLREFREILLESRDATQDMIDDIEY